MKIVADECMHAQIVQTLRASGRDVTWIAERAKGIQDSAVLEMSKLVNALLITCDLDFGELVYRKKLANHGVVLTRLSGLSEKLKAEIVLHAFDKHESEFLNSFT